MTNDISPIPRDDLRRKCVEQFVRYLGWSKPRRFEEKLSFRECKDVEYRIVWYESGETGENRTDCFLQVNDLGCYESVVYCSAAIYAPRFKICTGFWPARLDIAEGSREEALRLRNWLHRSSFVSYSARRAFRQMHPEAEGYSLSAIRTYGPPYCVQLVSRNGKPMLIQRKSARCKEIIG